MQKIFLTILFFSCLSYAQTVSDFMDTSSSGCAGLTVDDGYVYVVSSFSGRVHRKPAGSEDIAYETFDVGGSGYQGICKVGSYVYLSKPYNGSAGIYRFDISQTDISLEPFMELPDVFGLAHQGTDLFVSAQNKIYKADLSSSAPVLVEIAAGIDTTLGLKIFGDYLYVFDQGISKINLVSGNYEKETVAAYSGNSFTVADQNTLYATGNSLSGVDKIDVPNQAVSLLTTVENFIGTYDIVYADNALFVTTREGSFNKVAKIDLSSLNINTSIEPELFIYPNPSKDFLYINGSGAGPVVVHNELGQTLDVHASNNSVDVSGLPRGVYTISVGRKYGRFVKD